MKRLRVGRFAGVPALWSLLNARQGRAASLFASYIIIRAIITLTKVPSNVECSARDRPDTDSTRSLGRVEQLDDRDRKAREKVIVTQQKLEAGLRALHASGIVEYESPSDMEVLRLVLRVILGSRLVLEKAHHYLEKAHHKEC